MNHHEHIAKLCDHHSGMIKNEWLTGFCQVRTPTRWEDVPHMRQFVVLGSLGLGPAVPAILLPRLRRHLAAQSILFRHAIKQG